MKLSQTYIVYGMGKSGYATTQAILNAGGKVYIGDDNPIDPNILPNAIRLDPNLTTLPQDAVALIGAPGIPLTHPEPHKIYTLAKHQNMPILCDIELFYRVYGSNPQYQFIAITGTNGKSTTTALTTHLLQYAGFNAHYGGNIGVPALALPTKDEPTIFVLEISSYQADMCFEFAPDAVGFLNLTPDHIDRHGTIENYFHSKMRLFQNLHKQGKAYISAHDYTNVGHWEKEAVNLAKKHHALITLPPSDLDMIAAYIKDNPYLAGTHNYFNALTACALARQCGIENFNGLKTYSGLEHRTEFVTQKNTIQFINDSKATNAEATRPALNAYPNIYWLAGGVAKQEGILPLLNNDIDHLKHAFFYGQSGQEFYAQAQAKNIPCDVFDTLEKALNAAFMKAKGDESDKKTILLSPSCASFDQFKNFEQRGTYFKQYVKILTS